MNKAHDCGSQILKTLPLNPTLNTSPDLWIIGSFRKDTVAGDKRTEPTGWNIIFIASSVVDGEPGELS